MTGSGGAVEQCSHGHVRSAQRCFRRGRAAMARPVSTTRPRGAAAGCEEGHGLLDLVSAWAERQRHGELRARRPWRRRRFWVQGSSSSGSSVGRRRGEIGAGDAPVRPWKWRLYIQLGLRKISNAWAHYRPTPGGCPRRWCSPHNAAPPPRPALALLLLTPRPLGASSAPALLRARGSTGSGLHRASAAAARLQAGLRPGPASSSSTTTAAAAPPRALLLRPSRLPIRPAAERPRCHSSTSGAAGATPPRALLHPGPPPPCAPPPRPGPASTPLPHRRRRAEGAEDPIAFSKSWQGP
ncbi:hypothetical protein PVAP13_8KG054968 [Panicum virgatum]|uniref:Uncharacterized protein n=1 Tax=Panicum virgatum TaxID=38727 RepID=A0A8T0PHE2_PANVG|nr:hypothetical protein PVAP13_8KG054968 [Panicum virgatum]